MARFSLALAVWLCAVVASAQTFPGGFIEQQGSTRMARYTTAEIAAFMPTTRGAFTFPAPYNTRAARITDATDCPGSGDCLWYVGYSYWRNMNAHQNSSVIKIFLGLDTNRGGAGPTLFTYHKTTEAIVKVGSLFPVGSKFINYTAEGWYWSATQENVLYLNDGPKMLRYDVVGRTFTDVFDVTTYFGAGREIAQMHTSNDDLVHTATLVTTATGERLGCLVYFEATAQFQWYPKVGTFDECHLDKSGRWVVSLEGLGVQNDIGMRIFDTTTTAETRVPGPQSTLGHFDTGYGYVVGADNFNTQPNATILWTFDPTPTLGPTIHYNPNWNTMALLHPAHSNSKPDVPSAQQMVCGSSATSTTVQDEITCVRIDTSHVQLIVAPIMVDLNAAGGCCEAYAKYPKGNIDVTGRYFLWTANLGGNRLDAFLVKVPSQLLVASDLVPPDLPENFQAQ